MRYKKRMAVVFIVANTGAAQADDQAVISYTTTTSYSNNNVVMANMNNLGTDWLKRNMNVAAPPVPNNPIKKAKDPNSLPQKGFWSSVGYELGVAIDEAVMAREIEKIESEQSQ
jgi:hypothetical protein